MSDNDFYIGWMSKSPLSFSNFIKKYLALLIIAVAALGVSLALLQKKFGTGTFEFGKLTQIRGVYLKEPVPAIKVVNGKNIWGEISYITIPLVGYGKHGAEGIISEIEKEKSVVLDKKLVSLKGTLLYNDGKTILQIDKNDQPVVAIGEAASKEMLPQLEDLGIRKVKGEIVDPKCYFGVMKPGEGKSHRDCAIRCILGGIPPVFHVQDKNGESNYYLIVGPHGEKMNEAVRDYVAEPTEISARLVKYDDWIVMFVQDQEPIRRVSYLSLIRDDVQLLSCSKNCMK
jgi:hypothetical protein